MKVDTFGLTPTVASTGILPRAWRISTSDGVFWLLHDGTSARLAALPSPVDAAGRTIEDGHGVFARGTALALAAETEAASRWVRQGTIDRAHDVAASTSSG